MNFKIDFDPIKHTYSIDGIPVPGCTTVTSHLPKDWMAPWAAKECVTFIENGVKALFKGLKNGDEWVSEDEIIKIVRDGKNAFRRKADKAAASGTIAHDWIDQYIQARMLNAQEAIMPSIPEDVSAANSIKLFLEWEKKELPEWRSSEVVVGSKKYMVGGKYDWTAYFPKHGLVLGDNKTSNSIYDEQYIQVNGGYRMMNEETYPDQRIDNSMILWIPKTGNDFEARIVPTKYESDKALFIALLELHKCLTNRKLSYK